jgi:hypothetical protein
MDALIYLATARQARLQALACPSLAASHKARARYWLAIARRAPRRPLP